MGSNVNVIPKSITTTNHISCLTATVAALVVSRFTGSATIKVDEKMGKKTSVK